MDTQNITKLVKDLGKSVSDNSPTILTAMGVGGMLSTVFLAVKATPAAMSIIEQEQIAKNIACESLDMEHELLTELEVVQSTWKCYIPAFVMGVTTIACIIGSNSIHIRRNAALASVFSIAESTLREYQAKVVETIGNKKEEQIRTKIAEENMKKEPPQDRTIIMTGKGDYLCLDTFSGRYFRSDAQTIAAAVNDFNHILLREGWLDINAFYESLDLPPIELGDQLGWVAQSALLDVRYVSGMSPKNEPVLVMEYRVQPKNMKW